MTLPTNLLHQIMDSSLTVEERVLLSCRIARDLEESGNYEAAREAMGDLWHGVSEPPCLEGLSQQSQAEVLMVTGSLTGWIGSVRQVQGAQEGAKNLLSKAISLFEVLKQTERAAEARSDLAYCYWREGAFDEARVILQEALAALADVNSDTKAVALLRSAIVEESARRYHEALRIHVTAAPLFEKSNNPALKGKFHHLFGFVLKKLAETDVHKDYVDRALIEYAAASFYFEEAGLQRYQACVENNLGFLFGIIGKFAEAHEHLDRAQMLFTGLKDNVHLAQVDDTRARVMLAEGRVVEAEKTARAAVRTLEQGDEQSLFAEALTTQGIALARLKHPEQAHATLERAVEVAERAGDLESAGNAAMVMVEELGTFLSNDDLKATVDRARELLADTQEFSTLKRLTACTSRVLSLVHDRPGLPHSVDWNNFSLKRAVLHYEAHFIKLALDAAGGVVTRAARLLGFN
ncbi:MAG: hypothetical protein JWM21_4952, partial [Acidobacteria bacterium]|nr:hypothetical protein [Acidobacteriota bacterium]